MRKFLTFLIILLSTQISAQIAPGKYFVQFTDKNNTPYSLSNPLEFLTERAIQRRENQAIPLVENDLPVNPAYLQGVAQTGASILFPSKWLNGVTIQTSSQAVLNAIAALPYVSGMRGLFEEPLKQKIKEKIFFENESISNSLKPEVSEDKSGSFFDFGTGFTQINQINGIPLHTAGFRGHGMVMALLDGGYSGVDTHIAFDSIRLSGQILGTKDFTEPGGSVYNQSSHGTAVLSTIASNRPGQLIGTAPKASFWLLRPEFVATEHVIEEYNWVSAAEFADSVGVDVINSSLGYIDFDFPQWNHPYNHMDGNTCVVTIGADIASSKGILVVNSAGNSGSNSSFPYIGAPADGFSVFSIGAVNGSGVRASFSSVGPTFDGRIKPDVMAMGAGTAVTGSGSTGFSFSNGTSFSSPVLAGMATCLWQAKPDYTNLQIKQAIMMSADNSANPNVTYGHGIPDFMIAYSILTSIDTGDNPQVKLIDIYPNPFSTSILVYFRDSRMVNVKVYDIQGRLQLQGEYDSFQTTSLQSALLELHSGMYMIHAKAGNSVQKIKIIKN
jgi:serine protease AprX